MKPFALSLLVLLGAVSTAHADELLVQAVKAEQSTASARPTRGVTMAAVKTRFGQPERVHPAVGKPPITRWDYGKFSVFFEYNRVIHAVAHR